jgi:hypothetical protein
MKTKKETTANMKKSKTHIYLNPHKKMKTKTKMKTHTQQKMNMINEMKKDTKNKIK